MNGLAPISPWLALLLLLATIGGCGKQGNSTIPVSGKITYGGGEWPASGNITFAPLSVAEGFPRRPGSAAFQQDGSFEVTSFKPGDGLVPGTYSISISCYEQQPVGTDPSSFDRFNAVPKDFKTDDLVIEVDSDPIVVEFDVPKKN